MDSDAIVAAALQVASTWGVEVDGPLDLEGTVRLRAGGRRSEPYRAVVKERLPERLARATPLPAGNVLVVAPYIGRSAGSALRERGAAYLDATGAAHLEWDGLLIHTESPGRPRASVPRARPVGDAQNQIYSKAGQRVVFVLLAWPALSSSTLRTIAGCARVSLGSAHNVVDALTAAGHLVGEGGARRLVNGADLLTRWTDAYVMGLGRGLDQGRFVAEDPQWWRDLDDVRRGGALVGGEAAVSVLDPWLSPRTVTLYAERTPTELFLAHRLRRADDDGPVQLRKCFWASPEGASQAALVPSPLVYADLMASGEPRQRDAAARLRGTDDRLVDLDRS